MSISIIVALTKGKQVIGNANQLPWHLPEDLKRFKAITSGHTVLMGRKTYDSIGRPLPKRRNIVISRQQDLTIPGCEMASSLDAALKMSASENEVFVLGGGEIFKQALPLASKLYLTWIQKDFEGDVTFPQIPLGRFREISREEFKDPFPYAFANYVAL